MPQRRFVFVAQPALDRAISEREHCEQNVALMVTRVREEQQRLEECVRDLEKVRQQMRQEHDNLVSAQRRQTATAELMVKHGYIQALRDLERVRDAAVTVQRQNLRQAEEILADRKRDLAQAMAQVDALEKLKESRLKEFNAELAKRDEIEREDAAIVNWTRDHTNR